MTEIQEQKKELRTRMRALRQRSCDSQVSDSAAIASHVMQLTQWQSSRTILLYYSIKGEVGTMDLLKSKGKRLVLPVIEGENLVLREYHEDKLERGYQGIMEPSEEAPIVSPEEIELALIPGVAFDKTHHRLGRGKGFYDRLLPQLNCPLIGMGFNWQIVDIVPVESHDISLSGIVTPEGLI